MPVRLSVWVVVGEYLLCDSNAHIRTETPTTTTTSLPTPRLGDRCVKCGIYKKSGKRSCCARGGDWFKNCGDAGDTKFNHTWAEGVKACEGVVSLVLVESPLGAIAYPLSTTQTGNGGKNRTSIRHSGGVFDAGSTDSEGRLGLAKVVVGTCVLSAYLHVAT